MSRLTRLSVSEIQSDRLNVAKRFSEQWGVTVVLKGANTVICDPNGSSTISPYANPILSSASISKFPDGAGCGDVQVVFGNCDNVKGSEAPRYPKWQGSLIASYETASNLYIRGELFYNGGYYDEVTNLAEIPSATEINLRLGKRMDNITAELYVTNLTDEDAPLAGNNIADTSGYVRTNSYGYNFTSESVHLALRDKREFGVRFMYEF